MLARSQQVHPGLASGSREAKLPIRCEHDDPRAPGHVNLAGDDAEAIPVQGEFSAGDVLLLTYTFSTNESVTFEVPVVKPCGQYADIAAPGADAGEAAEEAGEEGEEGETAAETHDEEADATYLCDHPTESAEGEEGGH